MRLPEMWMIPEGWRRSDLNHGLGDVKTTTRSRLDHWAPVKACELKTTWRATICEPARPG
jgi:hypothetical protein